MLRKSLLFFLLHTVLVTTDEPGERRVQTINTAPITIHVPFPKSQESGDAKVVSDNTEGTYLVPVTEHHRPEPQPINLVLNLRLIMDREEKKPERTEAITVLTEPSPQPPARDNPPEFVAHPLKIMTQDSNPTVRPTPPPTQPVPQYVPDGLASGPAANVDSTRVSSAQSPSSKSYGVVPSYLLVPKRPVLHNVRSNMKADVPEVPLPEFRRKLLSEHNEKRMLHGVPPLTLDDKLNKEAQNFADQLARQKEAQRSSLDSRKGEGENIALRCSMKGSPLSEAHAANLWYDEGRRFNWTTLSSTPNTERFTQMVWKNTTRVGFGRAQFKDKEGRACFVIVARYEPIGNIVGKFADNVLRPDAAKSLRALKTDA